MIRAFVVQVDLEPQENKMMMQFQGPLRPYCGISLLAFCRLEPSPRDVNKLVFYKKCRFCCLINQIFEFSTWKYTLVSHQNCTKNQLFVEMGEAKVSKQLTVLGKIAFYFVQLIKQTAFLTQESAICLLWVDPYARMHFVLCPSSPLFLSLWQLNHA